MDRELNQLFNQVSYDLRSQFNDLISEISEPHKDNIEQFYDFSECDNL